MNTYGTGLSHLKLSRLLAFLAAMMFFLAPQAGLRAAPAGPAPAPDPSEPRYEKYSREDYRDDVTKAAFMTHTVPLDQILGSLAPIALSPFFALTMLSGASILSDNEFLPPNELLQGNPVLGNPWVFFVLAALTIFTSLPRFTKVSKVVAQVADFLETNAAIIIYLVILAVAVTPSEPSGPRMVYQAGVFEFSATTLIMILCVVNILIINAIRVFFELMVFLCPVPAVDAVFEIANKLFCLALALTYIFNPWLAAAFDAALFLLCLFAYALVRRRLTHYRAVLMDPVFASLRSIFGSDRLPQRHPAVLAALRDRLKLAADPVVLKVFPDQAVGAIQKRSKCFLLQTEEGSVLAKLRIIGGPLLVHIGRDLGSRLILKPGLLQNALRVEDGAGHALVKLQFTRAWSAHLNVVREAFDAELAEVRNPGAFQKSLEASKASLRELGRSLAGSVTSLQGPSAASAGPQ